MTIYAFAAALALGTAAPEPAPAPAPAPIAPAEQSLGRDVKPSTDMRRVCVIGDVTGSRLPRRHCQTRAEWVAQGVDPLATR
ncbi:hypothetical protein [Sphingomonas jeddahensis]|uniref:Uncharacterized protein n=1 Tax=Sphingomonas jeddahensis TaxID=1915074 RepID=A0A1V2EVN5_9SPHN|nr:hypothetical protein [Sphingomonas jeddahensis]ONF96239.1 hypothetical protein SPHI_14680 [Sphingomonas jeddahensis]